MEELVITLPDDLEEALEAYRRERDLPPTPATVVQILVRGYLTSHGYLVRLPTRPLDIPVLEGGSGLADFSADHDRYLAEDLLEGKASSPR